MNRQRIVALSAGTVEFWVVDAGKRTVQVTDLGGSKTYSSGATIPVGLLGGTIEVDQIFSVTS